MDNLANEIQQAIQDELDRRGEHCRSVEVKDLGKSLDVMMYGERAPMLMYDSKKGFEQRVSRDGLEGVAKFFVDRWLKDFK